MLSAEEWYMEPLGSMGFAVVCLSIDISGLTVLTDCDLLAASSLRDIAEGVSVRILSIAS